MAGECRDEVRVLDQLVDVADEGTADHVAAGNFVNHTTFIQLIINNTDNLSNFF